MLQDDFVFIGLREEYRLSLEIYLAKFGSPHSLAPCAEELYNWRPTSYNSSSWDKAVSDINNHKLMQREPDMLLFPLVEELFTAQLRQHGVLSM